MKYVAFLLISLLSGCVYGPTTEKKSSLNYLNGKNYDVSPAGRGDAVVVPILKTNERLTHIEGEIRGKSIHTPGFIAHAQIGLFDSQNREVQRVASDPTGRFQFVGVFPNGAYSLRLISKTFTGEEKIEIRDYEMRDILLLAEKE